MINENSKILKHGLSEFGITVTNNQLQQFKYYADELITWNSKFNLTAINTTKDIYTLHFLDSISAIACSDTTLTPEINICDIGSGAGFPGLVIKILYPNSKITLVESSKKKCMFLEHITNKLQLENVQILSTRIEGLGQNQTMREAFDVVTARAVSKIPTLLEYGLPLVKVKGILLDFSKNDLITDQDDINRVSSLLGGSFIEIHKVSSSYLAKDKIIIKIYKIQPTENSYPRRIGIPTKRPL